MQKHVYLKRIEHHILEEKLVRECSPDHISFLPHLFASFAFAVLFAQIAKKKWSICAKCEEDFTLSDLTLSYLNPIWSYLFARSAETFLSILSYPNRISSIRAKREDILLMLPYAILIPFWLAQLRRARRKLLTTRAKREERFFLILLLSYLAYSRKARNTFHLIWTYLILA